MRVKTVKAKIDFTGENVAFLVGGCISELFDFYPQFKKGIQAFVCLDKAVDLFKADYKKIALKSIEDGELAKRAKKCSDALVKIDAKCDLGTEADDCRVNVVLTKEEEADCLNLIKNADVGTFTLVESLFGVTKEFKKCLDDPANKVDSDKFKSIATKLGSLIGKIGLNLILPGASILLSGIKIGLNVLYINNALNNTKITESKRYRIIGKYVARIIKSIFFRKKKNNMKKNNKKNNKKKNYRRRKI